MNGHFIQKLKPVKLKKRKKKKRQTKYVYSLDPEDIETGPSED